MGANKAGKVFFLVFVKRMLWKSSTDREMKQAQGGAESVKLTSCLSRLLPAATALSAMDTIQLENMKTAGLLACRADSCKKSSLAESRDVFCCGSLFAAAKSTLATYQN